jgi:hypothetical protein
MKKKNSLMGMAKENMGIGIGSMAGMSVVGTMQGMPGVPAGASGPTMTALGLLPVAGLAKTGMGIAGMFGGNGKKKKKY